MAKNEFIPLDTALALADEYVSNLDDLCALLDSLEGLNPADVRPVALINAGIETVLQVLDGFHEEGWFPYTAYSELYDVISVIGECAQNGADMRPAGEEANND